MPDEIALLTFDNPVFRTYALAATIMLLKLMLQPWMTVARMMKVNAGFRSPEDAKKSPLNPAPEPGQLDVNEYVDRSRRINLNDLESIPGFLAAGFLFVLSSPPLLLAQILIWGYVAARAA
ncbi:MAG TPA: MAPEG family protein, partial [Gammaproteobacteria bacterium]